MAYVYRHIRLDKNEPFYIGIGSDDSHSRAYEKYKSSRSEAWHRIIQKTQYEVEIIFDNIDVQFAKQKEIEFIKIYGRRDLRTGTLVNMTDGGDGLNNRVFTESYRRKLSEAAKNRPPQPQLQKIIQWRREHRFLFSEETRKKISIAHKGKPKSIEHIQSLKESKRADKNPMFGKTGVMCPSFKGCIEAFKDNESVGVFPGVHHCAEKLNVTATKISACLNGRRNKTGGFTFKRL